MDGGSADSLLISLSSAWLTNKLAAWYRLTLLVIVCYWLLGATLLPLCPPLPWSHPCTLSLSLSLPLKEFAKLLGHPKKSETRHSLSTGCCRCCCCCCSVVELLLLSLFCCLPCSLLKRGRIIISILRSGFVQSALCTLAKKAPDEAGRAKKKQHMLIAFYFRCGFVVAVRQLRLV